MLRNGKRSGTIIITIAHAVLSELRLYRAKQQSSVLS